jgi:uncharacterized protein (TIGR03435 family)
MERGLAFCALIALSIPAPAIWAQSDQFEVATIKPSPPGGPGFGMGTAGHRFVTANTSLRDLIAFAYALHPAQIAGGPGWIETDKYDLYAEASGKGAPESQQIRTMVQNLMADRFSLAFHRATKELSVYTIVVGRSGPKFIHSVGNANVNATYAMPALGRMMVYSATITDFAVWMQRYVMDRPVVDQTGISGKYNFNLDWTPDETQFPDVSGQLPPATSKVEHPDLYTAIQQQLGLRPEATKAPVEILVIDRAERPSDN